MDDNATCHRTLAVQDCLDSEGIQRLVWPALSPDLNPIEKVWDALGRQVAGRNYPPTNKKTLIRALTEEWDKLPQQVLDNVVQKEFRKMERGEKYQISSSINHTKNLTLLTSSKCNGLNGQVTLSEWTKIAPLKKSSMPNQLAHEERA
ncbi:transposable element Tcb1 transposase [Trichonephila clavipes]|nr:transposable element Tcb1 transposase [Trichonephila clavipes]